MSASAFLERSKASLGELKLHVPALRARASSSPLRLHLPCVGLGIASCGGGSDGVSISRSFTAPGQAPSARREASDHGNAGSAEQHQPSLSSPIEMQQYRAVPEGHSYRYPGRSEERLVPANGNPEREDEYLPYSFPSHGSERQEGAVEARRSADVRPADAGLADVGLADADEGMRSQVIRQAYSTGNDAWMRTIENAAQARLPSSRIRGTVIPVWEVDVEAQLEGEMQQLIGARDYRFGELVVERAPPAISRPLAPQPTTFQPPAPQPRPHRPHHDPSKRKACIFNPQVDYTILHPHPNPAPETISPHLSTQDLASLQTTSPIASVADADTTYHQTDTSRYKTLITPTSQQGRKLHLPHPPPPASSTRQLDIIQARILDAETGRQVTYSALPPEPNPERQTAASRSGGRAEIRGEMSPPTVDGSTPQPLSPTKPNTASENFPLLVQAVDIGT
ncbi:MAG: hypothetical protein Q9188_007056, partial [Gyalolechia gomerana]